MTNRNNKRRPRVPAVGEHVWNLGDFLNQDIRQPAVLLEPWLRKSNQWMVHAAPGIGKTFFALNVAYAVASGGKHLLWKAMKPHAVLYCDGEMETWDMQERLSKMHRAALRDNNGQPEEALKNFRGYAAMAQKEGELFPDLATEDGLKKLLDKSKGVDLVVIDNLSTTMRTGEENDAAYWTNMQVALGELRKRGTAVLLVHHSNKQGDQRGTSAKDVTLNGKMRLEKQDGAMYRLEYEKHRSLSADQAPTVVAEMYEDDAGLPVWTHQTIANNHQEFIRWLKSGECGTQADIAEKMEVSAPYVAKLKAESINFGIITQSEINKHFQNAREAKNNEQGDF